MWRIGVGTRVKFWSDSWLLGRGTLLRYFVSSMSESELNLTVANYVDSSRRWMVEIFSDYLPSNITNQIPVMIPPSVKACFHNVAWNTTGDEKKISVLTIETRVISHNLIAKGLSKNQINNDKNQSVTTSAS